MKSNLLVAHADCVDLGSTSVHFSADGKHRYSLMIPFRERGDDEFLTIIGQNPSSANSQNADKTVRYLETFVYQNLPQYGGIQMLNLFSRIDTDKTEGDVLDESTDREFVKSVSKYSDALLIVGKLKNKGKYRFRERLNSVRSILEQVSLYKLDLSTDYAPHPGNSKIAYSNFEIGIDRYLFSDLR